MKNLLRALAVAVCLSVTIVGHSTIVEARGSRVVTHDSRFIANPTYPYTPQEIRPWWNATHPQHQISGSQSFYVARYFNAIVRQRVLAYLVAISQPPYGANWDRVAACESGGNWSINTGNGYYGGLQFTLQTWRGVGGAGYPHQNSRAEQIRRAEILRQRAGLGQWPVCGRRWYG